MSREELKAVRVVMEMNVEGTRGRGRPKEIWLDTVENDIMRVVGVCVGDVKNRDKWRSKTRVTNPCKQRWEEEKEEDNQS